MGTPQVQKDVRGGTNSIIVVAQLYQSPVATPTTQGGNNELSGLTSSIEGMGHQHQGRARLAGGRERGGNHKNKYVQGAGLGRN